MEGTIRTSDVIKDFDYYSEVIRSLNDKQLVYLTHLMHNIKAAILCYDFVTGGAGLVKSRLIQSIYQYVAKYYKSLPGTYETIKVVIGAPTTGKVAFIVGGSALHSLFSLPVVNNKNQSLLPINSSVLISFAVLYRINLCMFHNINSRLLQILNSNWPFGGVSVILFGDFIQVKPVLDSWIFEPVHRQTLFMAENCSWNLFNYFELTKIMRQQSDKTFAEALNRLSIGELTDADAAFPNSDILFFVETMTKDTDNGRFLLDNYFVLVQLNNDDPLRKNLAGKGMWCFVKESIKERVKFLGSSYFYQPNGTKEQYVIMIILMWNDVKVISVYKSNPCLESTIVSCLSNAIGTGSNRKVIVMGDFNVDLRSNPNPVSQFLNGYGIRSMEDQSTVNQRTQIDWICSNMKGVTSGAYETMFSYQKPVYIETSGEDNI